MLGQRRKRWASVDPALCQRIWFVEEEGSGPSMRQWPSSKPTLGERFTSVGRDGSMGQDQHTNRQARVRPFKILHVNDIQKYPIFRQTIGIASALLQI